MCGIFGVLDTQGVDSNALRAMSSVLRHRGPDDEGFALCRPEGVTAVAGPDTPAGVRAFAGAYRPVGMLGETDAGVRLILGHRRLAIHDLSPAGHQPMVVAGRYWIVFNGEVYNFPELREELRSLGHQFATGSDTEVILYAYLQWGEQCLVRFNGMWALAIYDAREHVLFLARDRFGVKPLYYSFLGGRFSFASEIKAILPATGLRPTAEMETVLDFLVWNVSDHTHKTMFEGVRQLPAGHAVRIDVGPTIRGSRPLAEADVVPRRWYELVQRPVTASDGGVAELRELLSASVDLRLRADVPVGSCLSGGLDSSSIVCLMSQLLNNRGATAPQKTFTASSADAAFDESRFARAVVQATGVDAHFVTPTPRRLFEDLDQLIWHQDEPFASTSIFAQWCVFDAARRAGVVVMLDGQGADETLGGYWGFFGAYLATLAARGNVLAWTRQVANMKRETNFGFVRSLAYTLAYLRPEFAHALGRFDGRSSSDRGWISRSMVKAFARDPVRQSSAAQRSVMALARAQVNQTNLPMLLHWEDRNSMAFSVEARVPFLDFRLVEVALGLEDAMKVGEGISKRALRLAMRGIVPDVVIDRRDKMGFVTAESLWVSRDMSARFRAELESAAEVLAAVVDRKIVEQYDQVISGQRKFDHRYWRAIAAARWVRRFDVSIP